MKIHLNLGSNLGNSKALIGRAIARLAAMFPPGLMLLSDYVSSEPWGYDSPNHFLNRGILYITDAVMHPEDVLDITQAVETSVGENAPHRNPDGTYCDRLIDIDIIDIDEMCLSTQRLTLPHPRAPLRTFVTGPMAQLENQLQEAEPSLRRISSKCS